MFNPHIATGSQLPSIHQYTGFFPNLWFNPSTIVGVELWNPNHQLKSFWSKRIRWRVLLRNSDVHTQVLTLGGIHLMTVKSSKSFCPSREWDGANSSLLIHGSTADLLSKGSAQAPVHQVLQQFNWKKAAMSLLKPASGFWAILIPAWAQVVHKECRFLWQWHEQYTSPLQKLTLSDH